MNIISQTLFFRHCLFYQQHLTLFFLQYFSGQYPHATIAACFFLCIISLICAILLNKETKDQPLTEAEE